MAHAGRVPCWLLPPPGTGGGGGGGYLRLMVGTRGGLGGYSPGGISDFLDDFLGHLDAAPAQVLDEGQVHLVPQGPRALAFRARVWHATCSRPGCPPSPP
jgi:hypothetical protein